MNFATGRTLLPTLAIGVCAAAQIAPTAAQDPDDQANPSPAVLARAWPDQPVLAETVTPTPTAKELTEWEVRSSDGDVLGTVADFVIDARSGEIGYVLVSSGGVLGVGDSHHPVPLSVLDRMIPEERALAARISPEAWENAPELRDERDATPLARESVRQRIHDTYRRAGATEAEKAWHTGSESGEPVQPRLAKAMQGTPVRSGKLELGTVDAVLVNLNEGEAMLRVELDPTTAGTNEEFIIRFSHISHTAGEGEILVTTFTLADFQRALPGFAEDLRPPERGDEAAE